MKTLDTWRTLALLLLLIFLASCRTTTDVVDAPVQIPNVLADGEALRKDAAEYAKDWNISLDEAIRRLELQTTIGRLDTKLANGEPNSFGGLWIQHEPTFKVIVNMTDSAEKVASYARGLSFASDIEIRKVAKTLKQLEAEQLEADRAAQAAGIQSESEVNVFDNKAVLYVKNQQTFKSAMATDRALTLPEGINIIETPSFSTPMVNGIAGQVAYDKSLNDPSRYCTTGYTVTINGYKGVTSAGHCDSDLTYGTGKIPMYYRGEWYGGPNDFQWFTSTQLTFQPWARDSETDTGTPGYRYIYDVANRPDQPMNAFVCKYGQTTKHTCGYIQTKTQRSLFPASKRPAATATYIRLARIVNGQRQRLVWGGDSGGPVYVGHQAWGMVSSGYYDGSLKGDLIYMAINYVTDQGFRILFAPRP